MKLLALLISLIIMNVYAAPLPPLKGTDIVTDEKITLPWGEGKKATVVVFLSSSCPCSNAHVDHLAELSKTYPDFKFVGIHANANETVKEGHDYFASKKLPFPVIRDEKFEWADRLKAFRTPHAYLITNAGEVAYQGGVTSSSDPKRADAFYLKVILKKFLAGEKIDESRTRVLGCAIAR